MNWKHIEAMIKRGRIHYADVDGQRIISERHMVLAFHGECPLDMTNAKLAEKLPGMWRKSCAVPCNPAPLGDCVGEGQYIARQIGEFYAAERFVRCLGDDVQWTPQKPKEPFLVHREGQLIALVMPMVKMEDAQASGPWTDEQVFAPWACEENGWYSVSISQLHFQLSEARDNLDRAEEEAAECRAQIASLRKQLEQIEQSKAAVVP